MPGVQTREQSSAAPQHPAHATHLPQVVLIALLGAAAIAIPGYVLPGVEQFGSPSPPESFWEESTVPTGDVATFDAPFEAGMKVRALSPGYLFGGRVYLGEGAGEGHTVSLWSEDGERLATAVLPEPHPLAWNEVRFDQPVLLQAKKVYVVSHLIPSGEIPYTKAFFSDRSRLTNVSLLRPLLAGGDETNGVYHFGSAGFPDSDGRGNNYWIDVLFVDTRALE